MSHERSESYQRLNAGYRRVMVYHVGIDAGFFAEYTAMLNAMLYAVSHGWQFRLYSDDANFSCGRGWTDFFEPFCPADHHSFHHRYNRYAARPWRNVWQLSGRERVAAVKWRLKLMALHAAGRLMAWCTYGRYVALSHNVRYEPEARFCLPELGVDGGYLEAFGAMADVTWRLNAVTAEACRRLTKTLGLKAGYVGCQIRGGDKVTETALLPPEVYVELIRRRAPGRDVFVLTDDYAIFRRVCELAPDIRWFTLCQPEEKGYVNSAFVRTDTALKRSRMERFLASMQLLMEADTFFGSITTGPSLFMLKKFYPAGIAVDCAPEDLSRALTLPIAERSRIAGAYLEQREKTKR